MRNIVIFLQKLGQSLKSLTFQDSWKYTLLRIEGVHEKHGMIAITLKV
jgi:hypothetical protein